MQENRQESSTRYLNLLSLQMNRFQEGLLIFKTYKNKKRIQVNTQKLIPETDASLQKYSEISILQVVSNR